MDMTGIFHLQKPTFAEADKFGISFCLGTDFQVKHVKLQMLYM